MSREPLRVNAGFGALKARGSAIHVLRTLVRRATSELLDRSATTYWRLAGVRMGSGCRIQHGVWIDSPRFVEMGDRCLVQSGCTFMAELLGQKLTLGADVHINKDVTLDHSGELSIGDRTVVSEGSVLYTHSHGKDPRSVPSPFPLQIGSSVWIGMSSVVLPGTTSIGSNSVVGARSVLTKPVPENGVVAGFAARQIGAPKE